MRGEQFILNKLILDHPDNPIQKDIVDKSRLKIIEVIEDEFWKEFRRKIDFSNDPVIMIPFLGKFSTRYSPLKGYIRASVRRLRRLRKRIAILKEKKNFDPEKSMTVMIERQLVLKVRASWKQLDQMRMTMIARIIVWNEKQRKLGTPEKIKRDYAQLEWKFKSQLLNNSKYYSKLKLTNKD